MRVLIGLLLSLALAAASSPAAAIERGLLWRVVQTCVLNHKITGGAFPCLSVETPHGVETGFAVLRAPNEDVHVIVTPTVRTIGIEAVRLRGVTAPDYFHDAWSARHFVTDDLAKKPDRDDLALAVNSKPGRSQDQLHIHIACVRPDVQEMLARQASAIRGHDWTRVKVSNASPRFWAHFEPSSDLAGINVFDRVAAGLNIGTSQMDNTTIVIVGAAPSGFLILARQRIPHSYDEAHGEALLDHECAAFKGS